jgi:hypothetical protein
MGARTTARGIHEVPHHVFNVQQPLEAVWGDAKFPAPTGDDAEPWVEIFDAIGVLMNQRHTLFLIAPEEVTAIATDILTDLNELAQTAAATRLNPKTDELRVAWAKTSDRLEKATSGFIGLAKLDLGLLIDEKSHHKRLSPILELHRTTRQNL